MKTNLRETTFIIPVGIESEDRKTNTIITLNYLCKYFDTNIIIYEYDTENKVSEILKNINVGETNISHIFIKNDSRNPIFHRTKFLNEMLMKVTTPVVVNYDVDILLKPEAYIECTNHIINGQDLVYPYFWGNSQHQVYYSGRDKILQELTLDSLTEADYNICRSEYGQCQFFNTKSYIDGGMENEGFISYAPEDQERGYRFKKLGYNVMWANNYIYHLEHTRGINSSSKNPNMAHNNTLFEDIKKLSELELKEYYNNIDYRKKYV
jgi:hypothetical protein